MYRKDIDGLRALAVIAVVAFHFGGLVSGGFVGVDIFFVISGFLITTIIVRDLEQNNFSFLNFYKRRIKRILPALYTVLLSCFVAAYYLMPPFEMRDMADGLIFSVLNASNIFFWNKAGYFDASSDYKPLLHTWSLSVEEQFYIFFPFLLWCLHRYVKISLPKIILFFTLCSFALSVYLQVDYPTTNFYFLPTRIWELGAGALLSVYGMRPLLNSNKRTLISILGLLLMLVPIFFYEKNMVFPGTTALPVVLGAVFFIWAGITDNSENRSFVNRFFEHKFFVFIGKISYSLYLWHWCVYVFCVLTIGKSYFSYGVMAGLSFILAVISYYLIESPLRHIKNPKSEKILLSVLLALSVCLVGLGILTHYKKGFWYRFDKSVHGAFVGQFDFDKDMAGCSEKSKDIFNLKSCIKGAVRTTPPEILAWGDSHGRAALAGLVTQAKAHDKNIIVRNKSGCVPLAGDMYIRKRCKDYSLAMLDIIKSNPFKKILLIGRWSKHYDGREFDHQLKYFNSKGIISPQNVPLMFEEYFQTMVGTVLKTGAEVYILDTVPTYGVHIPELLLRHSLIGNRRTKELQSQITTYDMYHKNNEKFRNLVYRMMKNNKHLHLLSASDMLCPNTTKHCLYADKQGMSYYRDTNHLSEYGSNFISPVFEPLFKD